MYLVGLPHIARDLGASEAQLHIAFSAYLAGMASSMLFAGKIADKAGQHAVPVRPFYPGHRCGRLLRSGVCDFARYSQRSASRQSAFHA